MTSTFRQKKRRKPKSASLALQKYSLKTTKREGGGHALGR